MGLPGRSGPALPLDPRRLNPAPAPILGRWNGVFAHGALAVLVALVLASAGQPVQTDDLWWHLALGRAYAGQGPWLEVDPLLHTASGPPEPTAWLAETGLFAIGELGGFTALRIAHVAIVAAILALGWSLLRATGGSRAAASLGTAAFVALSAYRLFQLRPELFTILCTLLLYRILLAAPTPPSGRRIAASAALAAIWANLHAGFLLGPILVGAGIGGLVLASASGPVDARRSERARARRLAAALALDLLATLANPAGIAPHLAWFRAGGETPALELVRDEWARLDLSSLPVANLPPSPLAWALAWVLLVLSVAAVGVFARARHRHGVDAREVDPALAAVAGASLAAMLLAVRFLWLGIFPLALLIRSGEALLRGRRLPRPVAALAIPVGSTLLVAGFVRHGDWPMISGTIPHSLAGYARPFLPSKYNAAPVWMLADAGIEGPLFNEYFVGGFLGYWLAPGSRAFVNGSLNLPKEALAAQVALGARRGLGDESFLELLDRYGVDLFLGLGVPQPPRPNRPWVYSTPHLERTDGWICLFRSAQSAVYLRADARDRRNLDRVARYYAREGVPFDPERGFDPAAVVREAPTWALDHGLLPRDFASIEADAEGHDPWRKRRAIDRLAALWTSLGLYEDAIELDRRLLRANPGAAAPSRRLVWSLLRLGRNAEAAEEARTLPNFPADELSAHIASVARHAETADAKELAEVMARLPVLTRAEASRALAGLASPPVRPWRD